MDLAQLPCLSIGSTGDWSGRPLSPAENVLATCWVHH
jgi:hypothetical protein